MIAAAQSIVTPHVDFLAIAPEIALGAAAVLVVVARALLRRHPATTGIAYAFTAAGIIVTASMLVWQWDHVEGGARSRPITTMAGMVRVDAFGIYLGAVILGATALGVLIAVVYLRREGLERPEYCSLLLFSALGMIVMTTANNLIVVFLALELLSIPLYVLSAFDRRRLSSQEAGLKYFVLGAFASAFFLYGVALTYGATGTTELTGISQFLARHALPDQGTLLAGFALLLVGIGFKVSAVPFHTWTPDVYQGAPTPVTGFMAAATKAAGFAALIRIFYVAFPQHADDWRPVVWVLAALTLAVGSIGALLQTDIKRLLAYSSIAHAGYVLMAFQAATPRGREAALFYLLVYSFMVLGSFAVVTAISLRGDANHSISSYRGLAFRRPVLGSLLVFFMLAQAGIPLTGGFIAKLEVFEAASGAEEYGLVVIGALATVVAAFAYLRVALSVANPAADADTPVPVGRRVDVFAGVALAVCFAMTLVLGLAPDPFVHWARDATFGLL